MSTKTDPDELVAAVGRRIAELRRAAGLSQNQFAHEHLHTSPQWLQRIEQKGANLTLHTLTRIANALGVRPADLLDVDDD